MSSAGPDNPISTLETSRELNPAIGGAEPPGPKRAMGFVDLVLFYVVTGISLRWIATAAGAGPSAVFIWIAAWLLFY